MVFSTRPETLIRIFLLGEYPDSSTSTDLLGGDREATLRLIENLLDAHEEIAEERYYDLRLRLVLHLAPLEAIAYDGTRTIRARHELILPYLEQAFNFGGDEAEALARTIHSLLDAMDTSRETSTKGFRDLLARRHGNHCAHCHVSFSHTPLTLTARDPYKPYCEDEDLFSAEVDHIEPISRFGTNHLSNLQLLCRLCNLGKGSGLGVNTANEVRYAGKPVESIPIDHRRRMFYYVVARGSRRCGQCGTIDNELTIRPIRSTGGFVRSNLQSICVSCAGFDSVVQENYT